MVLITDGTYSFALFNYGLMMWYTSGGDDSTGTGGGTPAQVRRAQ